MDRIGRTKVVNPGAFLSGGYALLYCNPEIGNFPDAALLTLEG
jgi:Icc-related predicted phosphoesterase